jgi:hypothetical protein
MGSFFERFSPQDCNINHSLLDSMPIITCSVKRLGKVAKDLTNSMGIALKKVCVILEFS